VKITLWAGSAGEIAGWFRLICSVRENKLKQAKHDLQNRAYGYAEKKNILDQKE
jgi:hypothetical protein